ncbi:HYR domain-containing protein [Corallococcus sp. AS-1-12]|uniref:HYR domain-containing protein n=1 Tax=Corallococcus sp. AS-1-12 TaxID=2874598 RepID=UPI001CC0D236|nr:HYR domain-containing protein [Corallococcus sp. AS-1-12]MBZ4329918.1 HYR domain-containing protein [Corallococcus sp. AS-1-12]
MRSLPGLVLLLSTVVSCAPPTPEGTSSSGTEPAHSRAALSGGASAPVLLGDLRTGVVEDPSYTSPSLLGVAGGKVLFADTDGNGYEPWVTDGTPEGTRPLGDLNPGPGGSISVNVRIPFGPRVLIPLYDAVHGTEWWVTDGTPEGTRFIRDSVEGTRGVTGQGAVMNGVFYFIADNGLTAWELWRTDATPEGTWRLARSDYGQYNNHEVKAVTVVGDALYFGSSNKLYRSDGTVEGTRLLKAFDDSAHSLETRTFSRAGRLYASVGYTGNWSLWTSDGTAEGTRRVSGGSGTTVAEDGDRLYYESVSGSRAPYSHSLSLSQEDPASTRFLKSVSSSRSYADMTPFGKVGSQLLFGWTTTAEGTELWRTDGTAAGTVLVKDLVPGTESSNPTRGTLLGESVYFLANTVTGSALWRTDGTAEGTVEVKTFAAKLPTAVDLRRAGAALVFTADDGVTGVELWGSDGTAEGTVLLGDLNPGATGSAPDEFAVTGDRVHFLATVEGRKEVWATDGTVAGTRRVKAVDPDMHLMWSPDTLGHAFFAAKEDGRMKAWLSDGTVTDPPPFQVRATSNGSSNPASFVSVGATAYFVPDLKGSKPNPIVQTDGTPAGTRDAIALTFWSSSGYPSQLTPFAGGKLAFRQTYSSLYVGDPAKGTATSSQGEGSPLDFKPVGTKLVGLWWQSPYFQLWTHTESSTTTTRLVSLYGSYDYASDLFPVGDVLVFSFYNPTAYRWNLTRTNGTASGTTLLKQMPARMESFTSAGNRVWFVTQGVVWRSDATAAGTLALTASAALAPEDLKATGGLLFFTATEAGVGREPWVSDGTVEGTRRLADFQPGEGSSRLLATTLHHGTPYLLLQNAQGRFLVRTDGTPAGTVTVAEAPGATWLVSRGGALLFDGAEPSTGLEPRYYLPGASTSTLLADVTPGALGSAPGVPVFAGPRMVFAATALEEGREPFAIELDGTGPSVNASVEGTQGGGGFYRSDVTVRFEAWDPESGTALSTVGCEPLTVTDDTPGRSITCTAYSLGGATPFTVNVKRDTTPPTVRCPADLVVTEGAAPAYDVKATDAIDAAPVLRVTPDTVLPVGQHTVQAEAADVAGNRAACQFQVTVLPAPVVDAGTDAGTDAGAGTVDAGLPDAGAVDAGLPDAGAAVDAGTRTDAGTGGGAEPEDSGCGCAGAGASASLPWVLLTLVGLSRRRARVPQGHEPRP